MARYRHKDWISLLKKNRNLETHSFILKDATGRAIPLEGPHIAVEALVPLIPRTAYRTMTGGVPPPSRAAVGKRECLRKAQRPVEKGLCPGYALPGKPAPSPTPHLRPGRQDSPLAVLAGVRLGLSHHERVDPASRDPVPLSTCGRCQPRLRAEDFIEKSREPTKKDSIRIRTSSTATWKSSPNRWAHDSAGTFSS